MTTRRMGPNVEIKVGQWINKSSMTLFGICGYLHQVTKVSKGRVYYMIGEPGEGKETYVYRPGVAFVSDTEAEAKYLHNRSRDQEKDIMESIGAKRAWHKQVVENFLKGTEQ